VVPAGARTSPGRPGGFASFGGGAARRSGPRMDVRRRRARPRPARTPRRPPVERGWSLFGGALSTVLVRWESSRGCRTGGPTCRPTCSTGPASIWRGNGRGSWLRALPRKHRWTVGGAVSRGATRSRQRRGRLTGRPQGRTLACDRAKRPQRPSSSSELRPSSAHIRATWRVSRSGLAAVHLEC